MALIAFSSAFVCAKGITTLIDSVMKKAENGRWMLQELSYFHTKVLRDKYGVYQTLKRISRD